jgi:hypothetical protein
MGNLPERNKKYLVDTKNERFIGIYKGNYETGKTKFYLVWSVDNNLKSIKYYYGIQYYDYDYVRERSKKAKEQMEKRALDIILKQVINDDFTW